MSQQFTKGGQIAWFHDDGYSGGIFHTYDRLQVAGPQDRPRKVHIFLPTDYEASGQSYPVIYMNDGDTAFFPGGQFNKCWYMAKILSDLYSSNQIREVIVVAIVPINRDREYTHASVRDRDCCGLDGYSDYIANPVKQFVDNNYRTLPDGQNTMILGSSHGGLAAFYIATKYSDKFHLVGALSPSFWVGLDSNLNPWELPFVRSLDSSALLDAARATLKDTAKRPKIYMDWGLVRNGEFHNEFIEARATGRGREMRDLLLHDFGYILNQNLFAVEDPSGDHTEESWSRRVPNVLKIFFGT
jgi:pimeloyl-ACP methyl ester carboxylesterase